MKKKWSEHVFGVLELEEGEYSCNAVAHKISQ